MNDSVIVDTAGRSVRMPELMKQAGYPQGDPALMRCSSSSTRRSVRRRRHHREGLPGGRRFHRRCAHQARWRFSRRCCAVDPRCDRQTDPFASTGEGLDDLEQFYPDRTASRILDLGDVLTLIEKRSRPLTKRKPARSPRSSPRTSSRSTTS